MSEYGSTKTKPDMIAQALITRKEKLAVTRHLYEKTWQDIGIYIIQNRQDFWAKNAEGERRDLQVFDSTAIQANELLAAALHGGLFMNKWFDRIPANKKLINNDNVKRWIADTLDIDYAIYSSSASNFTQQTHEFLLDLVAYGTACMYIDEVPGEGYRFSSRHLSEIFIAENSKGVVDTIIREFDYTARQSAQEWDESKLGRKVLNALEKKPDDKFKYLHIVMPRKDAERQFGMVTDVPEHFDFISYYVCVEDKKVVDVKGYYENPYIVVRWSKLVGEVYGRSPGWNVLADTKLLNTMSETAIRADQKNVDPALLMADDGVIMPLETFPSGVIIGGIGQSGERLIDALHIPGDLNSTLEMMNQRRDSIRKAYFVDQFDQKEGTPISATESAQRSQDRLRLTGPQLLRINTEYSTRVTDRIFKMNMRNGIYPPPPPELQGEMLNVEFVSPLVRSQKFDELAAMTRVIQANLFMVEADPSLLDVFVGDDIMRDLAGIAGVPLKNMRKYDTNKKQLSVEEIRQSRDQQQQQANLGPQMAQGAQAVAALQKSGINIAG